MNDRHCGNRDCNGDLHSGAQCIFRPRWWTCSAPLRKVKVVGSFPEGVIAYGNAGTLNFIAAQIPAGLAVRSIHCNWEWI
jgi:hypothetical protein